MLAKPWSLLTDWKHYWLLSWLIVIGEAILSAGVIFKVPYTEIDWRAYMAEVGGFLGGELDYRQLKGDTGPLVYPAGFVYLYSGLKMLTGEDVGKAQLVFWGFYVLMVWVVLKVYGLVKPGGGPWVVILLVLSKRIHSLFVLRLFNDGPCMLLLYLAVLCFMWNRWRIGSVLFSMAVSIKMNVLLFAPGLLLLYLRNLGVVETGVNLGICAGIQVVLGLPFLLHAPESYILKAFELSRVFTYKWTMNWKFLPVEVFESKMWALTLLGLHLGGLVLLGYRWFGSQWCRRYSKKYAVPYSPYRLSQDSPRTIALVMFACNFVGIAFARTLHPQFYLWYFHSVPLLLFATAPGPSPVEALLVFSALEYAYSYGQPKDMDDPATPTTSFILQFAHAFILLRLFLANPIPKQDDNSKKQDDETTTPNKTSTNPPTRSSSRLRSLRRRP